MENRILECIRRSSIWVKRILQRGSSKALRSGGFMVLLPVLSLFPLVGGADSTHLQNGGFESSTAGESWQVEKSEAKQTFSITVDRSNAKEGQQSLLIAAEQPVHLTLRQEVFLPIGTLWRLTGWTKSQASAVAASADASWEKPSPGPRIGIEAEVGEQGFSPSDANGEEWKQVSFLFRVPSPAE